MSPAERPSAPRHGALPPIRTRTSQPNADDVLAAAPADESKLQSRFKALAAEEDDMPASPQAFAVSRSLNRSIGVRRRTSDADGSLAASDTTLAAARRAAEEERELAEPDPLREQFEREKENNPLLRRPTIISARNSEKSMKSLMSLKSMKSLKSLKSMKSNKSKSSKRPSVGFALGEEEEYDVDPDAHLEAERIASITMPDEEPARAVRMAAVGLGVEPPVREESESGSASGEQRGGSGGGAQQESR
ncbi:hypothetical protein HYH02_002811 [Chlamydomonas schloesseri]|uniref:Uncharacterized protein n=1 Tax=Chlamydomonas schloesseri TaxID=2026947 RepID=A0A836BB42_9CHLO|nr:hypothetical protein HYH02_002811 [Chlamydomonas schloesseri]|eukprot:KAG2452574.1 hypothetical protein HYH02_002811 [Chlamydomonas schloesseri]